MAAHQRAGAAITAGDLRCGELFFGRRVGFLSLEDADLILTELCYEDRVGEIYHVGYNRAHRWYYFPDMQTDEALVFKVYDSATNGVARFTAHGAFDLPSAPAGAPPRQSIEVRTMTFFAPE